MLADTLLRICQPQAPQPKIYSGLLDRAGSLLVQRVVQRFGFGVADAFDLLEVLDTGFAHGFDRAEVVEQPLLVAFADAGNLVERAAQAPLRRCWRW